MTDETKEQKYNRTQKDLGIRRVQLWLPEKDIEKFKEQAERARIKHLRDIGA